MTSEDDPKKRRHRPLDQLPAPANSSKPLTPFGIEDILNKPSVRRSCSLLPAGHNLQGSSLLDHTSPLSALEELASKTFSGLEVSVLQAAEGRDGLTLFGQRNNPKKRRKSRTAFTNHQIYELEKRFLYQKYLSPADRDLIAQQLGLTNAQVITWFQNRRAKLKRDLEEMKADVQSAKAASAVALEKLSKLAELEKRAAGATSGGTEGQQVSCRAPRDSVQAPSPASCCHAERVRGKLCSDDEDEEIEVED